MKNEQVIRDAISMSISHDQITHVEIECSNIEDVIHDLVSATCPENWDYSKENDNSLDIYSIDTEPTWRINVSSAGASE